ncbi:MAG: hypothetical protein JO150_17670 [Acidobacteriaceae bacterium]|nr:hypothetical protein [Acidobacteriaceae bacterium]MBV9226580.1 hypothetical protein [Acidobacteriaceae bacterium]MBV9940339.1 hypothetical protein [Acidobacteriaceae bacterium]
MKESGEWDQWIVDRDEPRVMLIFIGEGLSRGGDLLPGRKSLPLLCSVVRRRKPH